MLFPAAWCLHWKDRLLRGKPMSRRGDCKFHVCVVSPFEVLKALRWNDLFEIWVFTAFSKPYLMTALSQCFLSSTLFIRSLTTAPFFELFDPSRCTFVLPFPTFLFTKYQFRLQIIALLGPMFDPFEPSHVVREVSSTYRPPNPYLMSTDFFNAWRLFQLLIN